MIKIVKNLPWMLLSSRPAAQRSSHNLPVKFFCDKNLKNLAKIETQSIFANKICKNHFQKNSLSYRKQKEITKKRQEKQIHQRNKIRRHLTGKRTKKNIGKKSEKGRKRGKRGTKRPILLTY